MITKEFLEEFSLFRRYHPPNFEPEIRYWSSVPINMVCHQCNSPQTFNIISNFFEDRPHGNNGRAENRVFDIRYQCQSCKDFERRFFVYINKSGNTMYKVGQYPEWEVKLDKNLNRTLHKHSENFKKGLVCESQGYGIGAFAYYRRITEDIIDELLDSIFDLIDIENQENYKTALDKTKQTRITQEKIELVKDLLPSILRPNGMNPLSVLHSQLSAGLHAESDEECLENANHIKSILTFLINQIILSKETAKGFTDSMKSLLDKKSKT